MKKLLLTTSMLMIAAPVAADQLYKWVDSRGVTHYGDAIPAEYASGERHVLNEHGITVKTMAREKTQEELRAIAEQEAQAEIERQAIAKQEERDRILLDTYLSVEEIAMLRDRRLLSIEAQVGVIRQYLGGLQERWENLESETRDYNFPYSEESELPPLPEDLAQLIIHTERAMAEHMQTVQTLRHEQEQIRSDFAADAERFKELNAQNQ